jgi:hypothetical protein
VEVAEVGHQARTHLQARPRLLIRRRKRIPRKLTLTLIRKRRRKKAQQNQKETLQSGMNQPRDGIQKEVTTRDPRAGLAAAIQMNHLVRKSPRNRKIGSRLATILIGVWMTPSTLMKGLRRRTILLEWGNRSCLSM